MSSERLDTDTERLSKASADLRVEKPEARSWCVVWRRITSRVRVNFINLVLTLLEVYVDALALALALAVIEN